jgi:type I restriction enzyme, R subunit
VATEADTCRVYVLPGLYAAGWTDDQIREQLSFTPGRIIVTSGRVKRGKPKRVDYLLSYRRDLPLAVVEAKSEDHLPDYDGGGRRDRRRQFLSAIRR